MVGGFVVSRKAQHVTVLFGLGQKRFPRTGRKQMKLNAAQLRKVEKQLSTKAVPEEHSVTPRLKEAFGDHTFFLNAAGLNIVEPNPSPESSSGNVVKLASWTSEERTELLSHEPEVLPVTVDLGSDEPDPAPLVH